MNLPYISQPAEISNEEYHRGEAYKDYFSSTSLKNYLISPKYARYAQLHPELNQQTPAMLEGTVFHDYMESLVNYGNGTSFPWIAFEKPPINSKTGNPYGIDTKAYSEALMEFQDANPGKQICAPELIITAKNMANELMSGNAHLSKDICSIVKLGKAEQSHFLEFEGGLYKYRTDVKTRNKIVDWKKTRFELPKEENFHKVIIDYGYHISAAMYQFFERIITGRWKKFYWVAQENVPPYDFNIIDSSPWTFDILGDDDVKLNVGALVLMKLLEQHKWCLDNQEWPGYSIFTQPDWRGKRISSVKVPGWFENSLKTTFYN